jgi:hypothetical protein
VPVLGFKTGNAQDKPTTFKLCVIIVPRVVDVIKRGISTEAMLRIKLLGSADQPVHPKSL